MPIKSSLKSRILDEKDRKILMILQENGRESLTKIAKKVSLSIDSVKNRIEEMQRKHVFHFGVFINPQVLGYGFLADTKIKLGNITEDEKSKLISYLKSHPHVIDLLAIMGDFDLTCVIIAKDANELDTISTEIRQKFNNLIYDWKSVIILKMHKFEHYDLERLDA